MEFHSEHIQAVALGMDAHRSQHRQWPLEFRDIYADLGNMAGRNIHDLTAMLPIEEIKDSQLRPALADRLHFRHDLHIVTRRPLQVIGDKHIEALGASGDEPDRREFRRLEYDDLRCVGLRRISPTSNRTAQEYTDKSNKQTRIKTHHQNISPFSELFVIRPRLPTAGRAYQPARRIAFRT